MRKRDVNAWMESIVNAPINKLAKIVNNGMPMERLGRIGRCASEEVRRRVCGGWSKD